MSWKSSTHMLPPKHTTVLRPTGTVLAARPTVELFTDGACCWPHGPGGAAAVTIDTATGHRWRELWGVAETTNNRAELTAIIQGLRGLAKKCDAVVFTDSRYVIDGVYNLDTWARDGWRRRGRRGARYLANQDLWRQLHRLIRRRRVEFKKVEAHSGVPDNELADRLAFKAALLTKQSDTPAQNPTKPRKLCRYEGHDEPEFLRRLDQIEHVGIDDELYVDPGYLPKDHRKERRPVNVWYGSGRGAEKQLAHACTPWYPPVEVHQGTHRHYLKRYMRAARQAAWELHSGTLSREARTFLSKLFEYATSYRMLKCGWDLTVQSGSVARGVDGLTPDEYANDNSLLRSTLKRLKQDLRAGDHQPSRLRRVLLDKPGGRGKRPIDIPTVEDRIVERALVLTLAPLLEPTWHTCNIGFRTGHGPQDGLAMFEWVVSKRKPVVAQTVDIRKAFTSIPQDRLAHAIRKSLPAGVPEQLAKLMEKIILRPLPSGECIRKNRGIAQGSPLSPMLLNVFLNRHLDWTWDHQRWPMIRYADDILLLADSPQDACTAVTRLRTFLQPNGLNLRDEIPEPANLDRGDAVEWLGFAIFKEHVRMRMTVTDAAWWKLEHHLRHAEQRDDASRRHTSQSVSGWLEHAAPAFRSGKATGSYRRDFVNRVSAILATVGMDAHRMPQRVIYHVWKAAHARWQRRRRRTRSRIQKLSWGWPGLRPAPSKTATAVG